MAMSKLALLTLVAAFLAGTTNGLAEYKLVVKTKEGVTIGTESLVVFEFYDSSGGAGVIRLIDGDGPVFDSSAVDTFTFYEAKGNEPCRLGLRVIESAESSWRPESVNVTVSGDISYSKSFPVTKFVRPTRRVQVDLCKPSATPTSSL